MSDLSTAEYVTIYQHLMAAKMFSLASCVMLFYDISLTFAEEVELIWSRKLTAMSALWFINRYLTPLGYVVVTVSFHDNWSKAVCNRYVLFPEALKVVTSLAIGVIFVSRLYIIYHRNISVAIVGSILLAAQLALKIWAFTSGTSLSLPPKFVGCILTGKSDLRFAVTWIAALVFDSAVLFATLYCAMRTHREMRRLSEIPLMEVILRDGVIYFAIIFAANLVAILMFIFAPRDIKAINASFSTLITSLMVSRLILNLRRAIANACKECRTAL